MFNNAKNAFEERLKNSSDNNIDQSKKSINKELLLSQKLGAKIILHLTDKIFMKSKSFALFKVNYYCNDLSRQYFSQNNSNNFIGELHQYNNHTQNICIQSQNFLGNIYQ